MRLHEQRQDDQYDHHTSYEPTPGKRTLTERLPVQRKAVAATEAPTTDSAVRPASASQDDPFGMHLLGRPVQRKAGDSPGATVPGGSGESLPAPVQAKMERAFGTDLSAVRVHEGPQAASIGALAYTQGTDIHFAPGQYQPESQAGQELLGHELTHVVQQGAGRVGATAQAKGLGVNEDEGLEREADDLGSRAARGEVVMAAGAVTPVASAVAQAKYKPNAQKKNQLKDAIARYWKFEDEDAAEVANEVAEYCDDQSQALYIIEKATYDQFCEARSEMTPNEFQDALLDGSLSKGSGKPAKVKDPLADVRKRINQKGHDLSLFKKEDLEGILLTKDQGGWDMAIQTAYTRVLEAKQNADLRGQLLQRYAVAKAAGDLIFNAGLLKDAWQLSYTIATSPGINVNTTLGGTYSDQQLINAAATWNGQPNLDGQVTNIHVPGSPDHVIEDKSRRPVNPDPSRGRQTDFISSWGGNKINVHANSDVAH